MNILKQNCLKIMVKLIFFFMLEGVKDSAFRTKSRRGIEIWSNWGYTSGLGIPHILLMPHYYGKTLMFPNIDFHGKKQIAD